MKDHCPYNHKKMSVVCCNLERGKLLRKDALGKLETEEPYDELFIAPKKKYSASRRARD
jgi:hypothetical protein